MSAQWSYGCGRVAVLHVRQLALEVGGKALGVCSNEYGVVARCMIALIDCVDCIDA